MLYREYTPDDLARPAFTQTLSYAAGSNIIRFRNVRIEVATADNEKIEYTVVADGYPAP